MKITKVHLAYARNCGEKMGSFSTKHDRIRPCEQWRGCRFGGAEELSWPLHPLDGAPHPGWGSEVNFAGPDWESASDQRIWALCATWGAVDREEKSTMIVQKRRSREQIIYFEVQNFLFIKKNKTWYKQLARFRDRPCPRPYHFFFSIDFKCFSFTDNCVYNR